MGEDVSKLRDDSGKYVIEAGRIPPARTGEDVPPTRYCKRPAKKVPGEPTVDELSLSNGPGRK